FRDMLLRLAIHHRADIELDRPGILARLQHDRVAAELERAQLEARARAHRRVEEQQRNRLAGELRSRLRGPERGRLRQQRIELRAGPVLGGEEMSNGHRQPAVSGKFRPWMAAWSLA